MTAAAKLCVIACPSLRPELDRLAIANERDIALRYLDLGLHDRSAAALHQALQAAIDATQGYDAIAVGYGLCNRGIIGITARDVPLVIPQAHDCIGLLLGSTQHYLAELEREPGTYFQNAGFLTASTGDSLTFGPASNASFERLAARYGENAAQYLMEQLEGFTKHYTRLAYIDTSANSDLDAEALRIATANGLRYQRLDGDTGWLARLLGGDWEGDDFLVVKPGESVVLGDDGLIRAA